MATASGGASGAGGGGGGGGTVSSASVPLVITAGNIAITPATTGGAGSLAAADKTTIDYLANRWESQQAAFLLSKVSQLTEFQFKPLAIDPRLASGVTATFPSGQDAAVEGGGVSPDGSVISYLVHTQSVFQTPKTGKWGFACRAKFAAIAGAGHIAFVGLVSADLAVQVNIGLSVDGDATHFVLATKNGTFTYAAGAVRDTSWHNHAITSDGTTITYWLDGVSQTTLPTSGLSADAPVYVWGYVSNTHNDGIMSKFVYGYIAP